MGSLSLSVSTGTLSDTRLPLEFRLVQNDAMHLDGNVGIKTQATSSGKPILRKHIYFKFIFFILNFYLLHYSVVVKLRTGKTDLLRKIFLNLGVFFCYKICFSDSFAALENTHPGELY